MGELLVTARSLLLRSDRWVEHGAISVRQGRVLSVCRGRAAIARAARRASRRLDLGDVLVTPGLINAHAHLELGVLAGRTPRAAPFGDWVRAVLVEKSRSSAAQFEAAVLAGAGESLRLGATAIADIDSTGAASRVGSRSPGRLWAMRELLDAHDASRTGRELLRVRRRLRAGAHLREGLSPHAPFTVSPALARGIAALARRRAAPVVVHWSETEAEVEWLRNGTGPLAALLGPSPRCSGLDLLAGAGLLRAPLALVHGNHPQRGEPERIARAGAVIVHCPGSHAWFGRAPFPWRRFARAGCAIALGTDSLASNESLDMRRELRLARASAPWLPLEDLFDAATVSGAQALGQRGELGELSPGALADFATYRCVVRSRGEALEALLDSAVSVDSVWVGGRLARSSPV